MRRQDARTDQASAHAQGRVGRCRFSYQNNGEGKPRRKVVRTIERLRRAVITVIERTVVVVIDVDVVSDTSLAPMDVNRRVAVGGMHMRRRQQASDRNHHHGENRQPPIV